MPWAINRQGNNTAFGTNTVTVTLDGAIAEGDFVTAEIVMDSPVAPVSAIPGFSRQVTGSGATGGTMYIDTLTLQNAPAGATSFVVTVNQTCNVIAAYIRSETGIATNAALIGVVLNTQIAPGTGADAVTSTDINAIAQPAALIGFSFNQAGQDVPNAGTGFTSRAGVWDFGGGVCARPEDRRLTVTGNAAATFTALTGADTYVSVGLILLEGTGASTAWLRA